MSSSGQQACEPTDTATLSPLGPDHQPRSDADPAILRRESPDQHVTEPQLGQAHEADQAVASSQHTQEHYSSLELNVDSAEDDFSDASELSFTTSVHSTAYDFVEENGRRYHGYRQGKYLLPNDEVEQDRLEIQHHLFFLTLGCKIYLAPIDNMDGGLHNALDIGTGTGTWASEFASMFPSAQVIGSDLSPIQPSFMPPNCRFEIDDAEDEWAYEHKFDYVHGRGLAACFKNPEAVIRSAFSSLRPGGYLEFQDGIFPPLCIDDTMKGTALEKWAKSVSAGAAALGQDWSKVVRYKAYLQEAGFEDVVEKNFVWPIGPWAKGKHLKTLGMLTREDFRVSLHGMSIAVLTRGLGMSSDEAENLVADVMKEVESQKIHAYAPIYVVYGRKPLAS